MLFFGFTFLTGVVALLVLQKMDIECVNQPNSKQFSPKRKAVARAPASANALTGSMFLQQ